MKLFNSKDLLLISMIFILLISFIYIRNNPIEKETITLEGLNCIEVYNEEDINLINKNKCSIYYDKVNKRNIIKIR